MATSTANCNSLTSAASTQPSVSVVIVSWNAKKYLAECIASLYGQCGEMHPEIIVVDNASSDGSPDLIAEQFPAVRLLRQTENAGFARANNAGIQLSHGDYLCLVNSDVKFISDCFAPMVRYMEEHPQVAMLGPKMLDAGQVVRRSTMRFPTVWDTFCRALGLDGIFRHSRFFGGQLMADFDHQKTVEAEVLNGWFWMVRRSALEQVGLLDEQFFMYGEDIDWCYRFRQAGKKIVFFAGAEAIHYGGASSSNAPVRFYLEMYRASRQYWRKHFGRAARAGFWMATALHHTLRAAGFTALYLCRPEQRSQNLLKMRRSLAVLRWLAGASSMNSKEANRA